MAPAVEFYLRSKKVFSFLLVLLRLADFSADKIVYPDWKDLISRSLSKSRFVFVLSICFFILNFSLYSIFNEHELTFEFGLKHKAQAPLFYGGDDGNRTHDPLLAGQVLSQLSYTPILGFSVTEN